MKKFCYLLIGLLFCAKGLAQHIYIVEDKKNSDSLQYDGTLVPGNVAQILSPGNVTVNAKFFNFGDHVQENQILFELTSSELLEKLSQVKMEVMEQTQALNRLKNWLRSSEVLRAENNMNRAQQQSSYARSRFEQTRKLYEKGIVSKEEYLNDRRFYEESQQNFMNAKLYNKEVKQKGSKEALKVAEMKLLQTKDQLEILSKKIQGLSVKSPLAGIVLPPLSTDGKDSWGLSNHQKAFQGGQVLALIADIEKLYVLIKVDEFDIIHLNKGMDAQIRLLAFGNIALKGKVQEINVQSNNMKENQTARFDVKIQIDSVPETIKGKLMLGMSATTKLQKHSMSGLVVPKEAVVHENGQNYVNIQLGNSVSKHQVQVGETSIDYVVINQGLKIGDKVVINS